VLDPGCPEARRRARVRSTRLDGADALDQLGDQVLDGAQLKAEARRVEARRLGAADRLRLTGHEAVLWLMEHPPEHQGPS
jgi:hypothetical protein